MLGFVQRILYNINKPVGCLDGMLNITRDDNSPNVYTKIKKIIFFF